MAGIKPSTMMMIGGGAVLFISTFLDWWSVGRFSASGWETDAFGILGIIVALFGLALAAGPALTTFANVDLPEEVVGFTRNQIYVVLADFGFLVTFGLTLAGDTGIGLILGFISSAVAGAGAFMEMRAEGAGSAPPTRF